MSYNFKTIKVINTASDLINIVLSKTQRKTPTVVHPGYAISRIRSFYMRKIKFCQETINEKLSNILDTFPKIQDIHPFYGDLFNVLYDKDHYKLALGHIKATRNMIENMSKDYLKLVKYGDSLYRCKCLKRAALGRICTMLRKINSSLSYLEQVRKHMARLPAINPYQRTILLTGYPNVGKSSFINNISRANVQVQPYPFTTQSLYVGHTEYKNLRYQVIDSPGILDHQLQEMNTIQMQSVTALAHLKSCIIYFVDPSQQCGYSVLQQIHLYNTLKPLFKNKPLLVAFNKSDIIKLNDLIPQKKKQIMEWLDTNHLDYVQMSTLKQNPIGIQHCKETACRKIYEMKISNQGTKMIKGQEGYIEGMYVAVPQKRDNKERPPVTVNFAQKYQRPNIKKLQQQNGGAGVFSIPLQQHYVIPQQWKYDIVPQIYNGKNIADFVDPDIWQKIQEIQKEEDLLLEMEGMKIEDREGQIVPPQIQQAYNQIKRRKHAFRQEHSMKKHRTAYQKNKSLSQFKKVLENQGIDPSAAEERLRNRSRSKSIQQIKAKHQDHGMIDEEQENQVKVGRRIRQASRSRSKGYQRQLSVSQVKGKKVINKLSKKWRTTDKKGQSDRFIGSKKPKHLFSGKTSAGRKDWR